MPTSFEAVVTGQVLEPDHVNRYIDPVNDLQKFREGTLPGQGDLDLGGHGLKNLSAGSATSPALTFDGDSDTGFFSPEGESLGVSTAGIERARFDAQGLSVSGLRMESGAGSGKVLTSDAAGIATWQVASTGVTLNSICEGRLTAVASEPVSATEVHTGSTLYYTPHVGNQIALFDGSSWPVRTFSQISKSVTGLTASTLYDVFACWTGSGVDLEFQAWSTLTARGTGLALQDGVLVKSGAADRRYLGTICTISSGGTRIADSLARRLVWNASHRTPRPLRILESAGSWTWLSPTWHYANSNSANRVEVVAGLAGPAIINLSLHHNVIFGTAPVYSGIGRDSSSAVLSECLGKRSYSNQLYAFHCEAVPEGFHYYAWLERGNGNVNTFYGTDGAPSLIQSGMVGFYHC